MFYMQALAVGWSIYWRQAAWSVGALLVGWPLFYAARLSSDGPTLYLSIAVMLAFHAVVFPRVVRSVLEIRYSDFRLAPRRAGYIAAKVRFWEAAALSAIVNLVPSLGGPTLRLYIGSVPLAGSFVLLLFPVLVGMPLAGWLLTCVPVGRLRIEIEEPLA